MRELPLWTVLVVSGLVLVIGLWDEDRPSDFGSDSVEVAGHSVRAGSGVPIAPDGDGDSPSFVDVSGTHGRSLESEELANSAARAAAGGLGNASSGPQGLGDDPTFEGGSAGGSRARASSKSSAHVQAPSEEGSFVQGIRSGDWLVRWPNGETHSEGRYENGLRDGLWRSFSMAGHLIEDVT